MSTKLSANPNTDFIAVPASRVSRTHKLVVTAMLGAVAFVLQLLEFPIPFLIPSFVQMDFSELPALLATFSIGPVSGVSVCLIKNVVKVIFKTTTGGVGELCNFLIGAGLVVPAGLIYRKMKSRKGALIGALAGALCMGVLSIPINYFISYPIYTAFMPLDVIIGMYQELIPSVNGLLSCLVIFNMPFTMLKGLLVTALCFLVYKPLSPLLHK
ncbi:MAG: ECF transporter S component [Oscillospiraceae bacterium]|nr:ECF transporter S component [Oscillospiraceae bacterium]